MLLQRLNGWSVSELPRLNHAIIVDGAPPDSLTGALRREVLSELPAPETYSAREAMQLVVHLGLWGASAARHFQMQDPAHKETPERSFDGLEIGPRRIPFQEYFIRIAARTGTGHYRRDSYASLVRWNVPTTVVVWQGNRLAELPGCFDDPYVRTYTGDNGERLFFELIKKSEALERAANDLLEPLSDGGVALESEEGIDRVRLATVMLMGVRQLSLDFTAIPPEQGLTPGHFLDVFRQFAVHWQVDDIPPSGALDPEFLKRDFLLGIDFPAYDRHVTRIFPALLDHERDELTRLMNRPTLPAMLLERLGLPITTLREAPLPRLREILHQHPAVIAYYLLLNANARAAGVHLRLAKRFLFKPQRDREEAGLPDGPLVSNRRGTTGMDELLLEQLSLGRKNHLLAFLHQLHAHQMVEISDVQPPPTVHTDEVNAMVRFAPGPTTTGVGALAERHHTRPSAHRPVSTPS